MRVERRDSCMQKSSNAFGARVHGAAGPSARRLLTVKRLKGKPFYVQAKSQCGSLAGLQLPLGIAAIRQRNHIARGSLSTL